MGNVKNMVMSIVVGVIGLCPAGALAQCSPQVRLDLARLDSFRCAASVVFDDGTGPALFATFSNSTGTRRFTSGGGWQSVPGGGKSLLAVNLDGRGPTLFLYRNAALTSWNAQAQRFALFEHQPPVQFYCLAEHVRDGHISVVGSAQGGAVYELTQTGWIPITTSQFSVSAQSIVSLERPDPTAPNLIFVGGTPNMGSDVVSWTGSEWQSLPRATYGLKTLFKYDDGNGVSVYASGHDQPAAAQPYKFVVRWTGSEWQGVNVSRTSALESQGPIYAADLFDDGTGHGAELFGVTLFGVVVLRDGRFTNVFQFPASHRAWFAGEAVRFGMGEIGAGGPSALWVPSGAGVAAYVSCPRCAADFKLNGDVSVADLLLYLDLWFAGDTAARFTRTSGRPTVEDLYGFVNAWLSGC